MLGMVKRAKGVFLVLRLFTETLGKFLISQLSDLPEKPVVSYALPGSVAEQNALNIYLVSMTEDVELRSNETINERVGLEWISVQPPVRLQCTYVVSAWPASDNPADAALTQLRLLSAAFRVFASVKTLPPGWTPESLKGPGLPEPAIGLVKDDLSGRPEFWAAAGCLFHPAFAIAATISLPVEDKQYDYLVEEVLVDYEINE